ncbi:MAG: ATP-binding protein [Clostridia bacterium]
MKDITASNLTSIERMTAVIGILILVAALLMPFFYPTLNPVKLKVEKGYLDMSNWDFQRDGSVRLTGEWEFYWNQLLYSAPEPPHQPYWVHVPSAWESYVPDGGDRLHYGTATYRIRIGLPAGKTNYGVKISNIRTASRFYVDGVLVGSSGIPAFTAAEEAPRNEPYTAFFSTHKREVELAWEVSNHVYVNSGIIQAIYFGDQDSITQLAKRYGYYDIALITSLLILSLFYLAQVRQQKMDRAVIPLVMVAFMAMIYTMTHSEKMWFVLFPSTSYEAFSKVQMICSAWSPVFLMIYAYQLYEWKRSKHFVRSALALHLVLLMLIPVSTVDVYSQVGIYMILGNLVIQGYTLVAMIRAIRLKQDGAGYLFVALLAHAISSLIQILNVGFGLDVYAVPPVAVPLFILMHGAVLSDRHARAYIRIRDLTEQLQKWNRYKDEFLLSTSYSIRIPLQVISHITQSLLRGNDGLLAQSQQEDVSVIYHTAKKLDLLVNDIVNYEQIRSGSIQVVPKPVDLAQVVNIIMEIVPFLEKGNQIQVNSMIPGGTYIVLADELRLEQIVFHLIDNALRHTDQGELTLQCYADETFAYVVVSDTETLKKTETQEVLFGTDERDIENLGLSISKHLVEQHGGMMTIKTHTNLTFSLPLALTPDKAVHLSAPPAAEVAAATHSRKQETLSACPSGSTILVVDDDASSRGPLVNLLVKEGYHVIEASNGQEALHIISDAKTTPDLCILDATLPQMSGFELCRMIRETHGSFDLPVLILLAGWNRNHMELLAAAGANDYLNRTFDKSDLLGKVTTLIQLKRNVSSLIQTELGMLRAQIKPHFLFNAINTIIWVSKRDLEQTRKLLRDLSDFLRGSFDFENRESLVTFESEMELTRAYLALEQARFGERLRVTYDLGITDFSLPPLIIQPLVENAVRHGLMDKLDGGEVWITTRKHADYVEIQVVDNGTGIGDKQIEDLSYPTPQMSQAKGTGIGLKNTNRRLLKQFGTALQIKRRDEGGTIITILIPWEG